MKQHAINNLYDKLYNRYGVLDWWPAESPYEVMVGAVLTQNTAWGNVEKAIANFSGNLTPGYIESVKMEELVEIIRPAGFFNQKALYLKEMTKWYGRYDYSVNKVCKYDIAKLRPELLSVKGIGKETADSILLYAFGFPTFVVDAYTKRLLTRLGFDVKYGIRLDYDEVKAFFEEIPYTVKRDVEYYNNYHALIVIHAKEHCRAKPKCENCPLERGCGYRMDRGE